MTVIAYDGRYVAADRQATNNGMLASVTKLFRHGRQVLAFSGGPSHGMELVVWFKGGAYPDKYPREKDDKISAHLYVFEAGVPVKCFETGPIPFLIEDTHFTAGCGRDYARAVLELGFSPVTAVEIASRLDAYCGLGVNVIDLKELEGEQGSGAGPGAATAACGAPAAAGG